MDKVTGDQMTHLQASASPFGTRCRDLFTTGLNPVSSNGRTQILSDQSSCGSDVSSKKYDLSSDTDSSSGTALSSDSSFSSTNKRKKGKMCHRRKRQFSLASAESKSSDEEEETLKPLEEIMQMATKPLPATPQPKTLSASQLSLSQSPTTIWPHKVQSPAGYVNNMERLLKEKEETIRINEMEKKLQEDIEQGMAIFCSEKENNTEEDLSENHRSFVKRFSVANKNIPDIHPGEEIFQLSASGTLFNHHTLDLRNSEFIAQSAEEKLIFSCDQTHQLMLATEGHLPFVYRVKKCPEPIMKWLFQMMSIHPSYMISVKLLNTLINLTCNSFTFYEPSSIPWIPSLQDVVSVFANMGVNFQNCLPLQHLQFTSCYDDLVCAINGIEKSQQANTEQVFTRIPETHLTNVIKFLGFCTAVYPASFNDQETIILLAIIFKLHLDKELRHVPVVDLHCLVENLFKNIKEGDSKMAEMCTVLSNLPNHHHDYLKLVQLVPLSGPHGRAVRRYLSLLIISKLLENPTSIPPDYESQMSVLCQCMVKMKPSTLLKKMQKHLENDSNDDEDLDKEAYYLTHSLLSLVNDASASDICPSIQRKYLLRLCGVLEKHIKSDIREDVKYFYRTKVKDLVARIYGKWQEILHYSRPGQGKLHDYWEPLFENPGSSLPLEECADESHEEDAMMS
ncbi:SMC5-SMC6 complex localization factor protein 2 [Bombina bombina]|uniref:SMC5-SMC6 complex localization factor protein 2 n=1 Tax=Bombina bombina TaxID=8345 RepID=UPI00235AF014|nr:SMC5-SMC6 complex localization factor protein 2 [Bombina bombina]